MKIISKILKSEMRKKGFKISDMARTIKMNQNTLYRKLNDVISMDKLTCLKIINKLDINLSIVYKIDGEIEYYIGDKLIVKSFEKIKK